MNSAQLYKMAFRKKRTYFWSVSLAILLFLGLSALGIHEGYEKTIGEEVAEQQVLSNVPYAEHFQAYAPEIGWPWELLAAVAYHESRYNPNVVSPGGARGVMQLMPVTGKKFGLNDSTFFVPKDNIEASIKYIARLQRQFRAVKDSAEQIKFVLASYNAGPAHIHDARRLAKKFGGSAYRWADAEEYLLQLKYEEYYTDSVVKYGEFKGGETTRYVHSVLHTYKRIQAEEAKLQASLSE